MHVLIDYRGRGHGKKIKGFCSVIMIFIFVKYLLVIIFQQEIIRSVNLKLYFLF